jgi:ribonuclease T1
MLYRLAARWLLLGLLCWAPLVHAMGSVAVEQLPPEARTTLHRILHHGPYPYARDGAVFGNYEHRLPNQPHGYYHEYTVNTPDAHNRGARRIVCGPKLECYYSGDHYRTFRRIKD